MVAPIQIGSGIEIGGGINVGNNSVAAFTINSSDLSNPGQYYGGYSSITTAGFTSDGDYLYNGVHYDTSPSLTADMLAAQIAAGFNPVDAWVWSISFATGGTCLARVGIDSNGAVTIAPIDQSNTGWQTNQTNGPTLAGTFTFPATFTAYTPATSIGNFNGWC